MKPIARWKAVAAAAFAAMGALALAACIVSPGKFEAVLDLRRDGTFTFSYSGEIYLLTLSKLAEMSSGQDQAFVETPCYDDATFEERPCTEEELAEQRRAWEQQAESRRQNSEREAEQMRQFLGGIDPSNPAAAEELAERLRRQEGWKRVEYRGDGLFDVEFSLSSRLGHDFAFPTIERFPMANSFVIANLRQGGSVRVEAPGFSGQSANPYQSMMMAGAASSFPVATGAQDPAAPPAMPEMEGTFRIVTDGQILANNTDEGPTAGPGGQMLEWKVNRRTQAAPTALIQLGN